MQAKSFFEEDYLDELDALASLLEDGNADDEAFMRALEEDPFPNLDQPLQRQQAVIFMNIRNKALYI